ncbi:cupin domain-containing protein [Halomicroarcula sp. F13]|uniref:Cupin domain-containing protein n=1 Tax=Haloarcula rubra TaxID=2487747 RepID=A0AAW4PX01_9EURY|nr:cupin domain-containing protein [Halomicroarcula rubra]MBX0325856.1 cupin domain-containing protein [Halomicroarcula rubra]
MGQTDRPVLVQWVSPESPAPSVHYHPTTETFSALEGQLTVVRDGTPTRVSPGDSVTVDPDQAHTFRNDTDETIAFSARLPSLRTVKGLYTVWGLAHERGSDETGTYPGPGPVHSLAVAADLSDETTMGAPLPIPGGCWAIVEWVTRLAGVSGIDETYFDVSFWDRHVEQPEWGAI